MPSNARFHPAKVAWDRTRALGALAFATLTCEAQRDVIAVDESKGSNAAGNADAPAPPQAGAGQGGATAGSAGESPAGSGEGALAGSGGDAQSDGGTAGSGPSTGSGGGGETGEVSSCATGYPDVPLTVVGGAARSTCSAALARDRMSYALCACEDLNVLGLVNTDAFDSQLPESAVTSGASVGINGRYFAGKYASVDGSLTIGSSSPLSLMGLDITGDIRLAGAATSAGPLRIGRDAWFARSVSVLASARIGRDLHLAPGSSVNGPFVEDIGGETVEAPFTLDDPCRCGPDAEFDLEAAVADARDRNDNATIGLAALPDVPSKGLTLELPCGRFLLTELKTLRSVRILVTGRAALFVAGDFQTGDLTIELGPDAELDWFVQGRLTLSSADRVGDPNRAAALRVYVGGVSDIAFSPSRVALNLHAPRSNVTLTGIGDLYGSVLGRTIHAVGALGVHYDRAVLKAGDACGESDVSACGGCGACTNGLACIGGACASCTGDADCCGPFVCDAGRCEPLLTNDPP